MCQFRLAKCSFSMHNTIPYIHPRLDSRVLPRFSDCYSLRGASVAGNIRVAITISIPADTLHMRESRGGGVNRV